MKSHQSAARPQSTRVGQSGDSAFVESDATGEVNDFWVSDLSNDLACFGLCDLEQTLADRGDELDFLSLTSDPSLGPGKAARFHHHELGM